MKLLLFTLALLGLGVAGIAIKIWAKKDGEFAGTCASQNPMLNKTGKLVVFVVKHQISLKTAPNRNTISFISSIEY